MSKAWHSPEYTAYLKSPRWAQRRRQYFRDHGYRCEGCGVRKGITVHHLHYRSLSREEDKDIRAMCWPCHRTAHQVDNLGRFETLAAATEWTINRAKRRAQRHQRCRALPLIGWIWN